MSGKSYQSVEHYFASFSSEIQELMQIVRDEIGRAAPNAEEVITYNMPGFKLNKKYLVAYAAYKNHIGFYPGAEAIDFFKDEISKYKWAKGSVQFPLDQKMPLPLIRKITKYRVNAVLGNK